ncbi:MAG: hypothetical protein QM817_12370 [Archangium sp.]
MTSCIELVDEVSVKIDSSALTHAATPSPELVMGILVALVGVVVSIAGAHGKHKAWSLLSLPPLAIAFAYYFYFNLEPLRWFGFTSTCLSVSSGEVVQLVARSFALVAVCFAQLAITVALAAARRQKFWWAAAVLLLVPIVTGGLIGTKRRAELRQFHAAMIDAQPVPNVRLPAEAPRAHVGLARRVTPDVEHAGARTGIIWVSRVTIDPAAAKAWNVDSLELTPPSVGISDVAFHRERGPLSLDFTYPIEGVADEGPSWLPLGTGNRFEFIATNPLGFDATKRKYSQKKAVMPEPTVAIEVGDSYERDGFRIFRVLVTRGAESKPFDLMRQNGKLLDVNGTLLAGQDDCRIPFLWAKSQCVCADDHVQWCVEVEQDGLGFFLRLALGVITLGVTELTGAMKGVGEAHERRGLISTRWTIDGVTHTLNER